MFVYLDDIFDNILYRVRFPKGNTEPRKFRVVIPYLGFRKAKENVKLFYETDDMTSRFDNDCFIFTNDRGLNVEFEIWKDFYDYAGKKNDKDDIELYLSQYGKFLETSYPAVTYPSLPNGHFMVYYKEETLHAE